MISRAYKECLLRIQKLTTEGSSDQLRQELAYLVKRIKEEKEDPNTLLPQLLAESFDTVWHKSVIPLEYADKFGFGTKADILRSYFAPETTNTAYFPSFWNLRSKIQSCPLEEVEATNKLGA